MPENSPYQQKTAESVTKCFKRVYTHERATIPGSTVSPKTKMMEGLVVKPQSVPSITRWLNVHKAAGLDSIYPPILKPKAHVVATFQTDLFKFSNCEGNPLHL